jgi:hypothetical protein
MTSKRGDRLKFNPNTYSSRRSEREPTRRARSKRTRTLLKTIIILPLGVLLLLGIWLNIRVQEIIVSGQGSAEYESVVAQYLSRNPFTDLKFTISSEKVVSELTKAHPEIAQVKVSVPILGNEINVEIVERNAQLVLYASDDEQYVVDEEGVAYKPYIAGAEEPIILYDKTDIEYELGLQALPSAEVAFIREIDKSLKSDAFYGEKVRLSYELTDQTRTLFANIESSGYKVKFQLDREAGTQLTDLKEVLAYFNKKSIKPSSYVDVRVSDKAFYK